MNSNKKVLQIIFLLTSLILGALCQEYLNLIPESHDETFKSYFEKKVNHASASGSNSFNVTKDNNGLQATCQFERISKFNLKPVQQQRPYNQEDKSKFNVKAVLTNLCKRAIHQYKQMPVVCKMMLLDEEASTNDKRKCSEKSNHTTPITVFQPESSIAVATQYDLKTHKPSKRQFKINRATTKGFPNFIKPRGRSRKKLKHTSSRGNLQPIHAPSPTMNRSNPLKWEENIGHIPPQHQDDVTRSEELMLGNWNKRARREMHITMTRYKPTTTEGSGKSRRAKAKSTKRPAYREDDDEGISITSTPQTILNVSFTGYWERKEPKTTVAPRVKNPLTMAPADLDFVYGKAGNEEDSSNSCKKCESNNKSHSSKRSSGNNRHKEIQYF